MVDNVYLRFDDSTISYGLEHFGVKGMHWGVWNDETRARRMGLHKDRAGNSLSNSSRSNSSSGHFDHKGLTDRQKTIAKTVLTSAAVVAVVGVGLYAAKRSGLMNKGASAVKEMLGANKTVTSKALPAAKSKSLLPAPHPFEESLPKIQGHETTEQAIKKVNPLFGSWGHGDNCTRCTTALEMRARGYDVEARPMVAGQTEFDISSAFKDVKIHGAVYDCLTPKEFAALKAILADPSLTIKQKTEKHMRYLATHPKTLLKMSNAVGSEIANGNKAFANYAKDLPDGARGNLIFVQGEMGHSVYWKKVAGKIELYDGQTGDQYHNVEKILSETANHRWFRTDNKEINWDAMQKQVREHNPYYDDISVTKRFNADDGFVDPKFEVDLLKRKDV